MSLCDGFAKCIAKPLKLSRDPAVSHEVSFLNGTYANRGIHMKFYLITSHEINSIEI